MKEKELRVGVLGGSGDLASRLIPPLALIISLVIRSINLLTKSP